MTNENSFITGIIWLPIIFYILCLIGFIAFAYKFNTFVFFFQILTLCLMSYLTGLILGYSIKDDEK